jgi:DNA repair exonuclease SbcCD nuclease subunit
VVLAIGDLHYDSAHADEDQKLSVEILRIVNDSTIRHGRKPIVVILGDTLHHHEKIFSQSMGDAVAFFKKLRDVASHLYILVGNHDMPSGHDYLRERHWLHAIKDEWLGTTVVDRPMVANWNGRVVILAPYVPPGMFERSLRDSGIESTLTQASAVFCHQEFRGAQFGASNSAVGDVWPAHYPFVISGHVHKNQILGGNVYYPGSAQQLAFGDSSKTVVAEILLRGSQKLLRSEIEIQGMRKKKMYSIPDIKGAEKSSKITSALSRARAGDAVRLSLAGTPAEFQAFLKTDVYSELVRAGTIVSLRRPRNSQVNSSLDVEVLQGCSLTRSFFITELERIVRQSGDAREITVQKAVFEKLNLK